MQPKKLFNNDDEFLRHFFPNSVIERLERKVASDLKSSVHSSKKFDDNPKTGILDFSRHNYYPVGNVMSMIEGFYKNEGYSVSKTKAGTLQVKKGRENYWVSVLDHENHYEVLIRESIF